MEPLLDGWCHTISSGFPRYTLKLSEFLQPFNGKITRDGPDLVLTIILPTRDAAAARFSGRIGGLWKSFWTVSAQSQLRGPTAQQIKRFGPCPPPVDNFCGVHLAPGYPPSGAQAAESAIVAKRPRIARRASGNTGRMMKLPQRQRRRLIRMIPAATRTPAPNVDGPSDSPITAQPKTMLRIGVRKEKLATVAGG